MSTFARKFKGQMPEAVDKEFDQLIAALNTKVGSVMARCVVFHNTVQSIPDSTDSILSFSTTELDEAANMRLAASNSYIKAPVDGFYWVRARVFFNSGTGYRQVKLLKRSVVLAEAECRIPAGAGGTGDTVEVCWQGNLNATDTLWVQAQQVTGGALNVGSGSRELTNELVVIQLF